MNLRQYQDNVSYSGFSDAAQQTLLWHVGLPGKHRKYIFLQNRRYWTLKQQTSAKKREIRVLTMFYM
jgi:hypothetical protein